MQQVGLNDRIDAFLCGLFILVVVSIAWYGLRTVLKARAASRPTANETPYEALGA